LVALAFFVYLGYGWDWTGFQGNKLFDWLLILVSASIPVAVGIGTFALNRGAKRRDDEAETQRAEEASLQAYLDYMSGMLINPEQPLRRSHMGDNLSVVARAQTLTVLGRLEDGYRKGSVLQFLYEAGLINKKYPVIDLKGADLSGAALSSANVEGTYLQGANLHRANLQEANLLGANLQEAIFQDAKLRYANLQGANLLGAKLQNADLQGADLQGADLQGAILQDAKLRYANLLGANLLGANLLGADLLEADLLGANLQEAILDEAILHGALLQYAHGLTQDQLEAALGTEDTTLPEGIDRPKW